MNARHGSSLASWLSAGVVAWAGGLLGATAALAGAQEVGEVFRDCEVCPEMVVVPPGSFMMGSPASEEGRWGDEGPQLDRDPDRMVD